MPVTFTDPPQDPADAGSPPGQARAWIARLASGGMAAPELAALKAWLAADPAHRAAFEEARRLWHRLGALDGALDLDGGGGGPMPRRPGRLARRAVLGGSLLAATLAMAVLATDLPLRVRADHLTAPGEQATVTLPDGTLAHLNTDTALAVAYDGALRRVVLLRGEALFEVVPDPARPFRVQAAGGVVQALGTAFAVRLGDDVARVVVVEGEVAVASPAPAEAPALPQKAVALAGGQQVAYVEGSPPGPVDPADLGAATAWRRGRIVIDGLPLGDAIAELDRYRAGRTLVAADLAGAGTVGGVFDVDDAEHAIATLAATQGLAVTRLAGLLIVH